MFSILWIIDVKVEVTNDRSEEAGLILLSRYSTLTNHQINLLLKQIIEVKKVQILDLLGLKIPDRNTFLNDVSGKYLNILECSAVYFNHIHSDQRDCLARTIFHFKRHLIKV